MLSYEAVIDHDARLNAWAHFGDYEQAEFAPMLRLGELVTD